MLAIHIGPEAVFTFGPFVITNTLIMSWVVVIILIILAQLIVHRVRMVPRGLQNIVELGVESLLGLMEKTLGSRAKAEKYFALIATIFTLVLISNWLGIVPGVGSIGIYRLEEGRQVLVPFLRSAASDLNFTLAIGIISVFATNILGIVNKGFFKHAGTFLSFKSPISFFVGILEFISELVKIISFSFRLFGNIFAGEILLAITGFLLPFVVPVPFLFLELFVGFIQALVFATLTLVFISIAIEEHA